MWWQYLPTCSLESPLVRSCRPTDWLWWEIPFFNTHPSLALQPSSAECFDDYQCVFHRFPAETGLSAEYSWDLRSLCADAGTEYVAALDPSCVLDPNGNCPAGCGNCDPKAQIQFNICGTVAGPIAPVNDGGTNGTGSPQLIPLPHSHGVAVQFIEGIPGPVLPPGYGPTGGCADLDTCDQTYNPTCVAGSQNYPANNPAVPATDNLYARRSQRCAANGAAYCSPYNYWCCSVQTTTCTKSAEVLAYYDGSPPTFNLIQESDPNGGVSLSFAGALPYVDDPFPCSKGSSIDPSTGYAPTRSVTVNIACDPSQQGLAPATFFEVQTCTCQFLLLGAGRKSQLL